MEKEIGIDLSICLQIPISGREENCLNKCGDDCAAVDFDTKGGSCFNHAAGEAGVCGQLLEAPTFNHFSKYPCGRPLIHM